jgi:hypothetical protein
MAATAMAPLLIAMLRIIEWFMGLEGAVDNSAIEKASG